MKINEIRIESWARLMATFDELKIHEDRTVWYLRGQAESHWPLTPSLYRYLQSSHINDKKAYGIEMMALHTFQSQAHLNVSNEILSTVRSILNWWMLMQHYSCPTRLLDWTSSPYVATYFAVEQCNDVDGAIWLFAAPIIDTLMTEKYGTLQDFLEKIIKPEYATPALYPIVGLFHTERSSSQQAVFTLCCDVRGDHGEIIANTLGPVYKNDGDPFYQLTKLIVPKELKHEFLSRLYTMNITAKTLFPGVDGIGRSASEIIRLRVWSGK